MSEEGKNMAKDEEVQQYEEENIKENGKFNYNGNEDYFDKNSNNISAENKSININSNNDIEINNENNNLEKNINFVKENIEKKNKEYNTPNEVEDNFNLNGNIRIANNINLYNGINNN